MAERNAPCRELLESLEGLKHLEEVLICCGPQSPAGLSGTAQLSKCKKNKIKPNSKKWANVTWI